MEFESGSLEELVTRIKAIFFDLDGTLVDSTDQIYKAVSSTRKIAGFPEVSSRDVLSKIGLEARELFSDLNLSSIEVERLVQDFRSHLIGLKLDQTHLFKGVIEFLEWACENNFRMAVATNKPKTLAIKVLQDTGIKDFFEFIEGADDLPPKPNPAIIIQNLENLKMVPNEVCMIGDRVEDTLAAKALGVRAYGVIQGPHSSDEHFEAGADKTFANFELILEFAKFGGFK